MFVSISLEQFSRNTKWCSYCPQKSAKDPSEIKYMFHGVNAKSCET